MSWRELAELALEVAIAFLLFMLGMFAISTVR